MPPPPPPPPPESPHTSATPLISSADRHDLQQAGLASTDRIPAPSADEKDTDPKTGKRRLFSFGKKKDDSTKAMDAPGATVPQSQPIVRSASPLKQQHHPDLKPVAQPIPVSPSRHPHQSVLAASPSRIRSSSPRLHSPASSEIFERNVQEPIPISTLEGELSPAHIPAHVITEDSIPPALEASAQAITSDSLNPDEVEIVTSASHQPAAATLESSASHADLTQLHSPLQAPLQHHRSEDSELLSSLHHSGIMPNADDDSASNYGQLDPNDVRRLSFISFKDIVHSEHQQAAASGLGEIGSRDSLHMTNLPSSVLHDTRAASPLRSPRSPPSAISPSQSGGVTTPPPGVSINPMTGSSEQSPVRSVGIGSPGSQHGQHGELTIETMRQALRKTASGDLGGARSAGMSPISDENSVKDALRSRTNT